MQTVRIENNQYTVAEAVPGLLFTDRITNITLSHNGRVIPKVSWQYSDGNVLPDQQNALLCGMLPISVPPSRQIAPLISLLTGGGGNYNYYHWLFDSIPRVQLAIAAFGRLEDYNFVIPDDQLPFQKETLRLLGIAPERQITSRLMPHIWAPRLVCTSHPNLEPSNMPAWIVNFLRQSFLPHASRKPVAPYVYVSRGDSLNDRRLEKEAALLQELRLRGFQSYSLSKLTFAEQIKLFQCARVVVGVHGAGLANLAFSSTGCHVIEIFSPTYQPDMYRRICAINDLVYHSVAGALAGPSQHAQRQNIALTSDTIASVLQIVDRFNFR
jgi:capsular polysaccharide biosynthesis protein